MDMAINQMNDGLTYATPEALSAGGGPREDTRPVRRYTPLPVPNGSLPCFSVAHNAR